MLRDQEASRLTTDKLKQELADELKEHVKSNLSKHKYPRWIVFVEDLPKNDRGKVDRKTLRERELRGKNPVCL